MKKWITSDAKKDIDDANDIRSSNSSPRCDQRAYRRGSSGKDEANGCITDINENENLNNVECTNQKGSTKKQVKVDQNRQERENTTDKNGYDEENPMNISQHDDIDHNLNQTKRENETVGNATTTTAPYSSSPSIANSNGKQEVGDGDDNSDNGSNDDDDDGNDDEDDENNNAEVSTGRWTAGEHEAFLKGLSIFGKEWKKISSLVPTRTVVQIRTHAQKYFIKLSKSNHSRSSSHNSNNSNNVNANGTRTSKRKTNNEHVINDTSSVDSAIAPKYNKNLRRATRLSYAKIPVDGDIANNANKQRNENGLVNSFIKESNGDESTSDMESDTGNDQASKRIRNDSISAEEEIGVTTEAFRFKDLSPLQSLIVGADMMKKKVDHLPMLDQAEEKQSTQKQPSENKSPAKTPSCNDHSMSDSSPTGISDVFLMSPAAPFPHAVESFSSMSKPEKYDADAMKMDNSEIAMEKSESLLHQRSLTYHTSEPYSPVRTQSGKSKSLQSINSNSSSNMQGTTRSRISSIDESVFQHLESSDHLDDLEESKLSAATIPDCILISSTLPPVNNTQPISAARTPPRRNNIYRKICSPIPM